MLFWGRLSSLSQKLAERSRGGGQVELPTSWLQTKRASAVIVPNSPTIWYIYANKEVGNEL